ncbi:uncharacterized protein N7477_008276 [Penicillium maclennaniae]|uniref:uncharacterized protein n=1 Tax=Penicillium maclennaniae TaxID=1343394 RepID=UPI00253FCB79|nr:uncharacterized protein N7477_008276 [Penicillium maclennaniae]KAJ5665828.1 hypothetical protein N7477_008276 [Penicillium maclennaniae]
MSSLSPGSKFSPRSAPPSASFRPSNSRRPLACVLCQQRKVKCDRKFPCANCLKFKAECIPAALNPQQRKRRFPERELLERIRKYEDLLCRNKVPFDPLHQDSSGISQTSRVASGHATDDGQPNSMSQGPPSLATSEKPQEPPEPMDLWYAMTSQGSPQHANDSESSHDEVTQNGLKRAWDQLFADQDNLLLFGSRKKAVELSTLHPEPVQLFRLWQTYLDNVDPLLKVTHTPSLQSRLIQAASNLSGISSTFEALLFAIYSIAIMSLTAGECNDAFESSREELLTKYQFGCQQALLNCGYLRTGDRECLTAFYLFLVSIGRSTDPRSMSSMLGIAMRIAYRMRIHSEAACMKYNPIEAEMARRLWWSFKIFDTRIGELADYRNAALAPTWDCKPPLNVNDADLRSEMKRAPLVMNTTSEALFVVVRSELCEFVRHAKFHLDSHSPNFASGVSDAQQRLSPEHSELNGLESMIEEKYLKFCNAENPLHYMTIWTTRNFIAKCRLVEHYSRILGSSLEQTERQRDFAVFYAVEMLESDTKIMTSPLTRRYTWHMSFYFPLPAYIHLLQDLKRRPTHNQAEKAWEVMSDNFEARFDFSQPITSPLFKIFTRLVLPAWDMYQARFKESGNFPVPPRIVSYVQDGMAEKSGISQGTSDDNAKFHDSVSIDDFSMPIPMPMESDGHGLSFGEGSNEFAGAGPDRLGNLPSEVDLSQLDWVLMDWESSELSKWYSF